MKAFAFIFCFVAFSLCSHAQQGKTIYLWPDQVPDKQDGALQDLQRAIRLVQSNAEEFGVDPDKIGVLGVSVELHF